jgi:hypothetical protein
MSARRTPLAASALILVIVAPGCESTQDKSAAIAESLGPVQQEKGLEIKEESKDVEVVDTALLSSAGETAVVVELRSRAKEPLVNVPILIDVLDAKGKSVYRNDIPGIEPALAYVPLIRPNETFAWVHNQVLAIGKPDSVKVKVGASDATLTGEIPDIEVRQPELENDVVSGRNARGVAINHTGEIHERLLVYGVVRRGDEIVAAGRAAIEEMKPDKPLVYRIYFVGDPRGADLEIASFPTLNST